MRPYQGVFTFQLHYSNEQYKTEDHLRLSPPLPSQKRKAGSTWDSTLSGVGQLNSHIPYLRYLRTVKDRLWPSNQHPNLVLHKGDGWNMVHSKSGEMVHVCNPRTREAGAGESSPVQGQPKLYSVPHQPDVMGGSRRKGQRERKTGEKEEGERGRKWEPLAWDSIFRNLKKRKG